VTDNLDRLSNADLARHMRRHALDTRARLFRGGPTLKRLGYSVVDLEWRANERERLADELERLANEQN
jgi:hypothetical protein